jgi:Ca2+-binding RTX toxin-like protein
MRTALTLGGLAIAVTGLTVTAPVSAEAAAAECQGKPATIVQDGGTVTGTDGDDVISTTGVVNIQALGGNDVICLSLGQVDAGPGNDSVLSLTGSSSTSSATLKAILGDGDDMLTASAGRYDASLGAGADRVVITDFDIAGSFDGGTGRDALVFLDTTRIDVDLRHGGVVMGGQTFEVTGLEDVTATADRITIRGDSKRNTFDLTGCIVKGYGGGGHDALGRGSPRGVSCTSRNQQLYGQGGNDRLTGNRLPNVLVGGGGRDAAYGKGGRDRCAAEVEAGCEASARAVAQRAGPS